jgi:hypothetical protein
MEFIKQELQLKILKFRRSSFQGQATSKSIILHFLKIVICKTRIKFKTFVTNVH